MSNRIPTAPQPWPETEIFWTAANENKFMLQRCPDTGKAFFYPRTYSPFTGASPCEWFQASGRGVIYSFSILPRAQPPYCIAYVTLDEGPRILTNIVTDDYESLRIGQSVQVTFVESTDGQKVPMFEPA